MNVVIAILVCLVLTKGKTGCHLNKAVDVYLVLFSKMENVLKQTEIALTVNIKTKVEYVKIVQKDAQAVIQFTV